MRDGRERCRVGRREKRGREESDEGLEEGDGRKNVKKMGGKIGKDARREEEDKGAIGGG